MASREQYRKVLDYIELAKRAGARVACGGGRPADEALVNGLFVEPTVLVDVTQDMRVAQDEIFGPVMSVLRWQDEATMLEQVNSVEYGLTGSVWTRDLATAHRIAAEMQAGYIWVNDSGTPLLGAPIGGYKQSGIGRVMCFEHLKAMTQVKNVHIKLETA